MEQQKKKNLDINYLNLASTKKDSYIYRIIPLHRLEELFSKKKNSLIMPVEWEDPFENFILQSQFKTTTGELATIDFHDRFYAQCWTLHKSSDAMWRIYAPVPENKKSNNVRYEGIRIRTTLKKLFESLSIGRNELAEVQCFIGKVIYLSKPKLEEFADTILTGFPQHQQLAQTLLVKRRAFIHEKEVRLIYFDTENCNQNKLFEYSIDPHLLIDQIMTDPRQKENDAVEMKRRIKEVTGFKGPITRSLLYKPPQGMVFNFG